jgi:hypothetical protein
MRDVGIIIWVALLIVGVVGSMVSSVRRQLQAAQAQQRPQRPEPAPGRQVPMPKPRPDPKGAPQHVEVTHDARVPRRRLFANKNDLVRAVIAAEVLGKPRAFGDEYSPR